MTRQDPKAFKSGGLISLLVTSLFYAAITTAGINLDSFRVAVSRLMTAMMWLCSK